MTAVTLSIEGGQVPEGEVLLSGAKNSATKLLAAAMLTSDKVSFARFPTDLVDVKVKIAFMRELGVEVRMDEHAGTVEVLAVELHPGKLPHYNYPIRTTYLLAAGQLQRNGTARIPYPGGCRIGQRKYDLHIKVWESMGCQVEEQEDHIEVRSSNGLKASVIDFPISTVGGTENALLCACIARGETVIRNAYITPEIKDLIDLLRLMGAAIIVHGNSCITVEGRDRLSGASLEVTPDRIEALTWMVYAVLSGGSVMIRDVPFSGLEVPLIHFREAGIDLFHNSRDVYVSPRCISSNEIQPFEVACGTYPGIISDMQPFFTVLALRSCGRSRIFDYRYPERIAYVEQLARFCPGALEWKHGEIGVVGPQKLTASEVVSTDLRGSMALILAALLADGVSTVKNAEMALRGYDRLEAKLAGLGVRVGKA